LLTDPLIAKSSANSRESTQPQDFLSYRKRIAERLPDIERVDILIDEYKKLMRQVKLSNKTSIALQKWLSDKVVFLGSKFYDHERIFERLPHLSKNNEFLAAYKRFVTNISYAPPALHQDSIPRINKNITILFTGCYGGGHKAPALALGKHFEAKG